MTQFRRLAILLIALTLSLAGGATAWLITGAGAAVPSAKTPPGPQPNGVNFTIHSDIDTNFCLEDTPAPQDAASEASMSECVDRDGQHWTFADAADGSVVIIGGNTGKCLDFTARPVSLVSMTPCTFTGQEHFFYNPLGRSSRLMEGNALSQPRRNRMRWCPSSSARRAWRLRSGRSATKGRIPAPPRNSFTQP